MANKGSKILIAILVVALVYIFGLILITSPSFQAKVQKSINKKTDATASDGRTALSEDELRKVIQEQISGKDQKTGAGPLVDPAKLAKEIAGLIDTDALAASVLGRIDQKKIATEVLGRIDQKKIAAEVLGRIDQKKIATEVLGRIDQEKIAKSAASKIDQKKISQNVLETIDYDAVASKVNDKIRAASLPVRQSEEDLVKTVMKAVLDSPQLEAQIQGAVEGQSASVEQLLASMFESGLASQMAASALEAEGARARQSEEDLVKAVMKAVLDSPQLEAQIQGAVEGQSASVEQLLASMFESGLASQMAASALEAEGARTRQSEEDLVKTVMRAVLDSPQLEAQIQGAVEGQSASVEQLLASMFESGLASKMAASALEAEGAKADSAQADLAKAGSGKADLANAVSGQPDGGKAASLPEAAPALAPKETAKGSSVDDILQTLQANPALLESAVGNWIASNRKTFVENLASEVASSQQVGDLVAHIVEDNATPAEYILSMMLDSDLIPQMIIAVLESSPDLLKSVIAERFEDNKEPESEASEPAEVPEQQQGTQNRKVFTQSGQDGKLNWEDFSKRKAEQKTELRKKLVERIDRGSGN